MEPSKGPGRGRAVAGVAAAAVLAVAALVLVPAIRSASTGQSDQARPTTEPPGPTTALAVNQGKQPRDGDAAVAPAAAPSVALPPLEGTRPSILEVRVISDTADGPPVPGAKVSLLYTEEYRGTEPRVDSAVTGSDGTVAFAIRPWTTPRVLVRASGKTPSLVSARPLDEGGTVTVCVILDPGTPFEGIVVDDETEAPVAGALVAALPEDVERFGDISGPAVGPVATDAAGRFRFETLPSTEGFVLRVVAKGYVVTSESVGRDANGRFPGTGEGATSTLRVHVARGEVLRGRVLAPDGKPVAGARVVAVEGDGMGRTEIPVAGPGEGFAFALGWRSGAWTTSVADGSFEIEGLCGSFVVSASAPGYARSTPLYGDTRRFDRLTGPVDLVLRSSAPLTVRLTDPSGRPVRGGRVSLFPPEGEHDVNWGEKRLLETAIGVFRIESPEPLEYGLAASAVGFPERVLALDWKGDAPEDIEVRMEPAWAMEGTVVDEEGIPVKGVGVHARMDWGSGEQMRSVSHETKSDATGAFRIEGLHPRPHRVYACWGRVVTSDPDFVVEPGGRARIVAFRPEYAPPRATVRFRLVPPAGVEPPSFVRVEGEVCRRGDEGFSCTVDPRKTSLRIEPAGFLYFAVPVTVSAGDTLDLGGLPCDPGVTVRGRVVDGEGRPVPRATVALGCDDASARVEPIATRADGGFVYEHLSRGSKWIRAFALGFLPSEVAVPGTTDPADVELRLRAGGILRIREVREPIHGPYRCTYRAVPVAGGAAPVAEDEGDEFTYETAFDDEPGLARTVLPGAWRVEVVHEGQVVSSRVLNVAAGETVVFEFNVPAR